MCLGSADTPAFFVKEELDRGRERKSIPNISFMFYSYLSDWYQQMDPHEGNVWILLFNEWEGTFRHILLFGGTFVVAGRGLM